MTKLSEAELKQRRLAIDSTIGTHAMEGLLFDEPTLAIMERFASGALTLEQFSVKMDEHDRKEVAELRPLAGAA